MAVLQSEVVPKNSGRAYILKKGQRLRIAGKSIVDFVAFNLDDLTERFDQARRAPAQAHAMAYVGRDEMPRVGQRLRDGLHIGALEVHLDAVAFEKCGLL